MSADPVQVQFYDRKRRDISNDNMILLDSICHHVSKRDLPNAKMNPGITPNKVHHAMNYDPSRHAAWVSSSLSSQIFKKQYVNIVFYLLLVFVLVGAALSSPATVISDSVVLRYLGGEGGKRYAHQRILGLCGWGIAAFVMGLVLDYVPFPWRKCEPLLQERHYTVCFLAFVVLMGLAIAVASTMKIPEVQLSDGELQIDVRQSEDGSGFENVHIDEAQAPVEKVPDIDMTGIPGSTVFAQQNKAISGWLIVLRHPQNSLIGIAFLFIAWIMGIGAGLIFTFLFWHLQDFGGTTTLFGLACLVNQVSEIAAYFFAPQFIIRLGHVNVLCVRLLCNVVRFLYISFLTNPWWVLPLEFVQGITHATIWAASCSYLTKNTPQDLKLQDQKEGLYHGLGRGFGTVIGGILVTSLGTRATFMLYSIICAITLVGFLLLTCYKKEEIGQINRLQEVGPHNIAADTGRSSK